jgi:hypothetical protein
MSLFTGQAAVLGAPNKCRLLAWLVLLRRRWTNERLHRHASVRPTTPVPCASKSQNTSTTRFCNVCLRGRYGAGSCIGADGSCFRQRLRIASQSGGSYPGRGWPSLAVVFLMPWCCVWFETFGCTGMPVCFIVRICPSPLPPGLAVDLWVSGRVAART